MTRSQQGPLLGPIDYDPFADAPLARVVPTTEAQREMWLACQLGRHASLAYNESVSLRVRGPLNPDALRNALQDLVNRHEALRATVSADGQSLYLADALPLTVFWADVRTQELPCREAACASARARAVDQPFDLERGPLFRAEVLGLEADDHLLVLAAHHIVCDGWSFGVLVTDLFKLYAQRIGLDKNGLPAPDSFANFALEQVSESHASLRKADTEYWVRVFDKSIPILDLPTDRARKPVRGFGSHRIDVPLEAALVDAVRKLGAVHGASLFVAMFGMFAALLSRLSGSVEVVVGVPCAGQPTAGVTSLVGHCVSLLPIRVTTSLEDDVGALLSSAKASVLDAYDHQHCTLGSLLKRLQVARDPGRLPLASVLFNLDAAIAPDDFSVGPMRVELSSNPRNFENFDLFLNATQTGSEVVLECQYNTDLFDASTVSRWLALYRAGLERAAANPAISVSHSLAPTGVDLQLLAGFNQTQAPWPNSQRIEELIARRVSASPDRIAVTAGAVHLSYHELDKRANALALRLRALGAGPGQLLGLACGRNEHMVVGILGILKSGAGYVPLDPAFPSDRLEFMCQDAALRHVVTDRSVERCLRLQGAQRIWVDELGCQADGPSLLGGVDDVAYVIYTSGSTGKPKGVRVPHRTVTNLLESVRHEPGMTESNTVLSVTTLSFDISISEVILPLSVGARIVVADGDAAVDGDRLKNLVESERVDFIDATPSTWRLLLAADWMGSPTLLAICTGEPLPPDLGRELLPMVGQLWNGYGPTETTVWSTFHKVDSIEGAVPIGRPIANTQIHVVDTNLCPVPVGVVGEILIGGAGVTLGYLDRPMLTSERFLPDPFSADKRNKCYRTGDLGRWRSDGVLECLGRSDQQVKVRGFRIELGEIEANLLTHPSVLRAVVVTREDQPNDMRIVGYVVARTGAPLDVISVQTHLRTLLPEYMVPQHIVSLPSIPLLPNGKVDRGALPRPDPTASAAGHDHVAPRSVLERQVLSAMEQVLNLPGLGVCDDFFAHGGHSLLAAQLSARLSRETGTKLPLRAIFETPTAEGLARALAAASACGATLNQHVEHLPERREAPLTVMQDRIRFMEELHPGRVLYNTPSAHRLTGPLDFNAFENALRQMALRQPVLRTALFRQGVEFVQRVLDDIDFHLPFEDLTDLPKTEREAALMLRLKAEINQPFDLSRAPLWRVRLYRMDTQQHVLLFMAHHIIWDGWSFDILYRELAALYPAELAKSPASLPEPAVTYLDFAHWHVKWIEGRECHRQLQFWKARYAQVDTVRALPTDRPRQAGMTGAGAVEWVHIDKDTTESLRSLARRQNVTMNMLVMSIYAAMLSRALDARTVVLGVPVRGRLSSEIEHVMGFFNNLLPMPLHIDGSKLVCDWVASVKGELLDTFANQDVPFEVLTNQPEISAHTNIAGLYQSLFSFQDARDRERQWGPLRHESVLVMQEGATEDFGLWLMEVPGGLEGGINYNSDIFDAATARLFKDRLLGLLGRLAGAMDTSIADLLDQGGRDTEMFEAWVRARQTHEAVSIPPREVPAIYLSEKTLAEHRLSCIWARLLGIDASQISPNDNFFDLGGNSLLVMQAAAAILSELGIQVDPSRFVHQDLKAIARDDGSSARQEGLAAVWAELLGVERSQISGSDNFFDLGGSSLLAMRAVENAQRILGLKVEPTRLISESLEQLATTPRVTAPADQPAGSSEFAASSGLFSRVLGRLRRRH